jgi:hypothetical protein
VVATFLSLAQDVGTDSGLISHQNKPATVDGALGKWADSVRFTAKAWETIQRSRQDWEYLRADFSALLTAGKASYTGAELGVTSRFARFAQDIAADFIQPMRLYDPVTGLGDSQNLHQISPECWSMIYGRGEQQNNRPTEYALANNKIYLGAIPDKAYRLDGSYWKAPQVLSLDTDVPDLPEHFHDAIKWRAIMMVAGKGGAFTDRIVAQAEYSQMYRQIVLEQTRPTGMGAALA